MEPFRLPSGLAASLGNPHVVAVEGPNGAGKSRLCWLLSERLAIPCRRGVPAEWESPAIKLRILRDADWLAAAMYYLSGVIESSREVLQSAAELQVMDRSLWSTLAVHYACDPGRLDRLLPLVELAADRIKAPDLTIVLEAAPETCRRRIARKAAGEQQYDAAGPADEASGRREREFYQAIAAQWPKVVFLPTDDREPEEVYRRAAALIGESF